MDKTPTHPNSELTCKRWVYKISVVSFIFSVGIGLVYRAQLTGWIAPIEQLDLRRVHTHIGFYLVFFPIVWLAFKVNSWTPGWWSLLSYLITSALALLSFLFLGYGLLSKILSGFVLIYWLFYALANLKLTHSQRGWAHPFIGIILATGAVGSIIYFGIQGETLLAKKAVRMFMTCLLWGTFAPLCLEKKGYTEPNVFIWTLAVFLTSLFAMNITISKYTFLGPIALALLLCSSLFQNQYSYTLTRLRIYWLFTAISLFLFGVALVPNQHNIAIGGIHLIILGPILQSIFNFEKYKLTWIYDISLLTMISAICIPAFFPQTYYVTRSITTLSSMAIVAWLTVTLLKGELGNTNFTAKTF